MIIFILSEEERFISYKLRKRLIFTVGGYWTAKKLSNISDFKQINVAYVNILNRLCQAFNVCVS
ncbi:MAG: hypothetical protein A3K25_13350 [Planctomycetes bacterium RIFOXYB12_FULL_42_10]|nr:MAG: hypothetical protein A3K25_13350 [Planctomycetes bacterium RIFOXYB12_FULL_42_10]